MHTVIDIIKGSVGQILNFNRVYTIESVKIGIIDTDNIEVKRKKKSKILRLEHEKFAVELKKRKKNMFWGGFFFKLRII